MSSHSAHGACTGHAASSPHDRQRERGQLAQVVDLPREMIDARRPGLGARELAPLELGLVDQAVQPPRPAVAARDHARFGEQALPFPRRAEGARLDGRPGSASSDSSAAGLGGGAVGRARRTPRRSTPETRRRAARPSPIRHLAEREVLGEPARRQVLERAGDERQERAARRVRPARAALEIHGNAGALERVLEQPARSAAARAARSPSDRTARRGAPRAGRGARSRPTRALRRAPRTAPPRRAARRAAAPSAANR